MMNLAGQNERTGGLWIYAGGLSRFFMTSTLLIASFATYQRVNVPQYTRDDVIEQDYERSDTTWCASGALPQKRKRPTRRDMFTFVCFGSMLSSCIQTGKQG